MYTNCMDREIMADVVLNQDFCPPERVMTMFNWRYLPEQWAHLANTIPSLPTLRWLQSNGFMLMAGPPMDMNFLMVKEIAPELFHTSSSPEEERFTQSDIVVAGQWLMLRKDAHPQSWGLTTSEQLELLSNSGQSMPNAAELAYGLCLHNKLRGGYWARHAMLRTSSVSNQGLSVAFGYMSGAYGISFRRHDWPVDNLGVSSVRRSRPT